MRIAHQMKMNMKSSLDVTKENQNEIKLQVQAGVALLDKKQPNWRNVINLAELDLKSCEKCILGQVFHRFEIGKKILNIERSASNYGFDPDWMMIDATTRVDEDILWEEYDKRWKQEILRKG